MLLTNLYLAFPLFILFTGSLFILLFSFLIKKPKLVNKLNMVLSFFILALAWFSSLLVFKNLSGQERVFFEGALVVNPFSFWAGSILSLVSFITLFLFQKSNVVEEKKHVKFLFLFLNSFVGAFTVLYSNSIFTLFMGLEFAAVCVYLMRFLAEDQKIERVTFGGFIVGGAASAIFLLGAVLVFGAAATELNQQIFLNIPKLKELSGGFEQKNMLFLLGSTLMTLVSFFKLGLFPFHGALPEFRAKKVFFMSYHLTASKIIGLLFLVKLMMSGFFIHADFLQLSFQWIVVLSMVMCSLLAFNSKGLNKILAYSGVVHSGYMVMSLMGFGYDGKGSLDSFIFYLFSYVFFSGLVFYVLQKLEMKKGFEISLFDLKGLMKKRPFDGGLLLIGFLGLSGLPPLMGFMTKIYIFKTAIQTGFYWVVFWSLIATAIGALYYVSIMWSICFKTPHKEQHLLWSHALETQSLSSAKVVSLVLTVLISMGSICYFPLNS